MSVTWDVTGSKLRMVHKECGTKISRSEIYDAYFCTKCNVWAEEKCRDKTCEFCSKRPETPDKHSGG